MSKKAVYVKIEESKTDTAVVKNLEVSIGRILRKLPKENAFYFFTSIGNYTGESAASLEEFLRKNREIDIRSLEFHLYRGDFEKWIAETLEDKDLAEEIKNLQNLRPTGDTLRSQLIFTVSKRYEKLLKPRR